MNQKELAMHDVLNPQKGPNTEDILQAINREFKVYKDRTTRRHELQTLVPGPEVPRALAVSRDNYDAVAVTARMLSVYDASHGVSRSYELYKETMWSLLQIGI